MHPEIEKLIVLALADGQITEKERNVILKKAAEFGVDADEVEMTLDGKLHQLEASKPKAEALGIDKDEVEMILDGRLHQLEASKPKLKQEVGSIKTCPACGASVKPFTEECSGCGHVFRHDSLNKLTSEIKNSSYDLVSQISMHAIPINREALIEFLTFSYGNANNKALGFELRSAWNSKFNEALEKAKFSFQSLEDKKILKDYNIKQMMLDLSLKYTPEEKLKQERGSKEMLKNPLLYILYFFVYLVTAFFISLTGKHLWPF